MHAYPIMIKQSVGVGTPPVFSAVQRDVTQYANFSPGGIQPSSVRRGFVASSDPATTGGGSFSVPATFTETLSTYSSYDSFGNVLTQSAQSQPKPTSISYDANGLRPTLISEGAGNLQQAFIYNTVFKDKLMTVTNAAGTPTTMHYNLLGQVFVTKDADNNLLNANYQNIRP